MKIRTLLAFLGLLVAASALPAKTMMNGTWLQLFSNNYVQTTTEVDWKCITVHVDTFVHDENRFVLFKTAKLHGGPQMVITPVVQGTWEGTSDDAPSFTLTTATSLTSTQTGYDVHRYNNHTLVITGKTKPALYVWTRGRGRGDDAEPVDIPRLMTYIQDLGVQTNDTHYNNMLQTYNDTDCP